MVFISFFKSIFICVDLKLQLIIFINLIFISSVSYSEPSYCQRALVLEGQNFNTAIHVGIFDGFMENGWNPDFVIASCGGAIGAALIHAIPDPEKRKAFLLSGDFFNLINTVEYCNFKLLTNLGHLMAITIGMTAREYSMQRGRIFIPPLFDNYLLEVPNNFNSIPLHQGFSSLGTRVVIIGAKLNFTPEDVGQESEDKKIYQEVFFTDIETSDLLRDMSSPIAVSFPNSAISFDTQVITNQSLGTAVRVSISDPYLMNPAQIDEIYFLGGAINLYPIEIAYRLANTVAMVYPNALDFLGQRTLASTFGFDNNTRLRKVTNMYADYWFDFLNFEALGDHRFNVIEVDIMRNELRLKLPKDIETFRADIQAQYEFGYNRAVEALQQSPNSKNHIRGINK